MATTEEDKPTIEYKPVDYLGNVGMSGGMTVSSGGILDQFKKPLAIRSSSLLEDSQYKPLAGMYSTFMLPNSHSDKKERMEQLCEAIKRVYASTFFQGPKSLMDTFSHRHEEEKMGIIIMELIGQKHNNLF